MAGNDAATDKASRPDGLTSSFPRRTLLRDAPIAVGGAALIGVAVTTWRAHTRKMTRQASANQSISPYPSVGTAARSNV